MDASAPGPSSARGENSGRDIQHDPRSASQNNASNHLHQVTARCAAIDDNVKSVCAFLGIQAEVQERDGSRRCMRSDRDRVLNRTSTFTRSDPFKRAAEHAILLESGMSLWFLGCRGSVPPASVSEEIQRDAIFMIRVFEALHKKGGIGRDENGKYFKASIEKRWSKCLEVGGGAFYACNTFKSNPSLCIRRPDSGYSARRLFDHDELAWLGFKSDDDVTET